MATQVSRVLYLLNGPNLDQLGSRDPGHYGTWTLEAIVEECRKRCEARGFQLHHIQSNHEGVLVEAVHEALGKASALLINAGAYSHTSLALRDAVEMLQVPVIEVHLSNIHAREPFRRHSLIGEVSTGVIAGFKEHSYFAAVELTMDLAK